LFANERDLHWRLPPGVSPSERISWVELKLDDRAIRFRPVYALTPGVPELRSQLTQWADSKPPLLIAPELRPPILRFCREARLAALDLNGRAYIRAPGVLIDRQRLPGRNFKFEFEPRNVFVGKSVRIVRSLLSDRGRVWTQKEIVGRTGASGGLVSRIVQHLIRQGFAERQTRSAFALSDAPGLVDAWAQADEFTRRTLVGRYNTLGDDPLAIARRLQNWADGNSKPLAFTQWLAGWLRHPYTEPLITSAYVGALPNGSASEALGLRPVDDGGKVWLFVPDDEGVFLENQQADGLNLVSDAQIYLDLQQTGLRGPEQADALRRWEGFCRP